MASSLSDRVFVVTGGFGALGRALAAVLLEEGARVALLDRAPAGVGLPDGDRVLTIGGADLGDAGAAAAAFAQVRQRWQRIDGLVNVAGGFAWETVGDGKLDTWDRLYAMNLRSAVSASQAALPYLSTDGRGRIVNIAALGAVKAATGMGAYAASKAGVMRFTEALAEELKDRGITVNAVLPSIIDTPANRADMPDAAFDRWVTPQALGYVIKFLLSDDAAAITVALLPVAGRT